MMNRKNMDLRVAYIFSDGHTVMVYRKDIPEAKFGYIEVVEVIEGFCTAGFVGRVVIHDTGMLAALKGATSVRAAVPALENGYVGSTEKGIPVGYLSFVNAFGYGYFYDITGVCGGGYSYQPEEKWEEKFTDKEEGGLWCEMKIVKIYPLKKKV
jgi:hypothetical protein